MRRVSPFENLLYCCVMRPKGWTHYIIKIKRQLCRDMANAAQCQTPFEAARNLRVSYSCFFIVVDICILILMLIAESHVKENKKSSYSNSAESRAIGVKTTQHNTAAFPPSLPIQEHAPFIGPLVTRAHGAWCGFPPRVFSLFWVLILL